MTFEPGKDIDDVRMGVHLFFEERIDLHVPNQCDILEFVQGDHDFLPVSREIFSRPI